MQVAFEKELIIRIGNIIIASIIVITSIILANNVRVSNYPIVTIEPFSLNVSLPKNLQTEEFTIIKKNKNEIKNIDEIKSNIVKEEVNRETIEIKSKNIYLSMIMISKKIKKCIINNTVLMENQYLDQDIKVLKITEYGVILQTNKGDIFVKIGEHEVI